MARKPPQDPRAGPPFRPARPVVVGITGGVAAGKSTVAELFCGHGLVPVDADAVAREVAGTPEIVAAVRSEFGPDVLDASGQALDRQALADVVFPAPDRRARLEAILHPPIRARILADLHAAKAAGHSVLLDAPLMHETGLVEFCDVTVFVDASAATRRERAAARGWSDGELARREAAQVDLAVKKAHARHTIQNDGDLTVTAQQVAAVLDELAATGAG